MEADQLHHSNRHRKLNFNAPLLSTRRHPSPTRADSNLRLSASQGSNDRTIPFSWEQAPGKPKELFIRTRDVHDQISTPCLKAPPSWSPRPPLHQRNEDCGEDEWCDGDDDDNDVYPLSEAIDIVERAEKAHKLDGDLKLKLEEYRRETPSPSFMMERFLPDATALAASSALKKISSNGSPGLPVWRTATYSEKTTRARQPCSSPKGCGLQILLPNCRIKQRLCGVKSPVREGFVSVQNPCRPKQCRPKQKKHYQN